MAQEVDNVARIEATSYTGVSVVRVFLHEGASTALAATELASSALAVLKYMPRNITPPSILPYSATDVPIIQLALSSNSLSDTALNDLAANIIRPSLAVVRGASVTTPYGGKPRVVMADLDQQALQSRGLTPADVAEALLRQNVIMPSGDVKIGSKDYTVALNNSPSAIDDINAFPIKQVNGKTVFVRDIAHVHDGYQVQTNAVTRNGLAGVLIVIRKSGGNSTLAVINGTSDVLPEIRGLLPSGVTLTPLFDQSIFVKAALNSVVMGGLMAAGLTALMILLFLGNWRLTLIILASIPLSIIAAVLVLYLTGQTLNTMTLGGFALAVGILVDNAHGRDRKHRAPCRSRRAAPQIDHYGAAEVGLPTFLATLSISVVFVPVFLLTGTAKYLFSPLSLSVIISLAASLLLSFTLVPVLFNYLMASHVAAHRHAACLARAAPKRHNGRSSIPSASFIGDFETGFEQFREIYRNVLGWTRLTGRADGRVLSACSSASRVCCSRCWGWISFRRSTPVRCGFMCAPLRERGSRIRKSILPQCETALREIIGDNQIDVILDNIGLPYSGSTSALTDSATVGPMDGEILISLKEAPYVDRRAHGASCGANCRNAFRSCNSSSSPPTSSIRCSISASRLRSIFVFRALTTMPPMPWPRRLPRPQWRSRHRRFPCLSGA